MHKNETVIFTGLSHSLFRGLCMLSAASSVVVLPSFQERKQVKIKYFLNNESCIVVYFLLFVYLAIIKIIVRRTQSVDT
jgi:hypothetical protein